MRINKLLNDVFTLSLFYLLIYCKSWNFPPPPISWEVTCGSSPRGD